MSRDSFLGRRWRILILCLSLYTVIELSIEIVVDYPPNIKYWIEIFDTVICMLFLTDFFFFLKQAPNKTEYWKKHWMDFISSIPFLDALRVFRYARIIRLFRFFRVIRLLREVKSFRSVFVYVDSGELRFALVVYSIVFVVMLFYCSLAFYHFERLLNENVSGFDDALWWAFITVTSVGYGDIYPITGEGRLVAVVLTLLGMGLFSLVTAEFASRFVSYFHKE